MRSLFLLGATLVLVVALALQTPYAVRSHREMAESVLRDYAALAAVEFARRTANEVGFLGYYPLSTALREAAATSPVLKVPVGVPASEYDRSRTADDLARTYFRFSPATGALETAGAAAIDPAVASWLKTRFSAPGATMQPPDRRYVAVHAVIGGVVHSFVWVTVPAGAGGGAPDAVGFEVERAALRPRLIRAVERGPLLPPTLAKGEVTNALLFVRFLDPSGAEIFRHGHAFYGELGVDRPYGSDYYGMFEGFTVHAAINPAAASRLVIGGLPRSRLPVLATLLLLTAGLLIVAMGQLQRERALARLRSDFVSRVSHELRTPLTQIRMFAETLLLGRVRSEEERQRSLAVIDRESLRLSHLVENVLRFSRAERGENRLAPEPRDLVPFVGGLVEEFRPLADGAGAKLVLELPERAVAPVDVDALRQILLNLLDNAVKYGPSGQTVRVSVEETPSSVRLAVEDEGPGIPPRESTRVFDRYYRLESHRSSAVAGTGIGLAVVRELAELHGGAAIVEPGTRGARFVVTLPKEAA